MNISDKNPRANTLAARVETSRGDNDNAPECTVEIQPQHKRGERSSLLRQSAKVNFSTNSEKSAGKIQPRSESLSQQGTVQKTIRFSKQPDNVKADVVEFPRLAAEQKAAVRRAAEQRAAEQGAAEKAAAHSDFQDHMATLVKLGHAMKKTPRHPWESLCRVIRGGPVYNQLVRRQGDRAAFIAGLKVYQDLIETSLRLVQRHPEFKDEVALTHDEAVLARKLEGYKSTFDRCAEFAAGNEFKIVERAAPTIKKCARLESISEEKNLNKFGPMKREESVDEVLTRIIALIERDEE